MQEQDTLKVMVERNIYIIPVSDVERIGKSLQKKLGVNEEGLFKKLKEVNERISRPHKMSFHQNDYTCGDCIHSRVQNGGTVFEVTEASQVGCTYKDTYVTLDPPPPNQEVCEWLAFYRLALLEGLLELHLD